MQLLKGTEPREGVRGALCALLLIASAPLTAAVYQCQGPDGSTVYSDKPCGSDAKLIIVRPQAPLSNSSSGAKHVVPNALSHTRPGSTELLPTSGPRPEQDSLQCQGRQYLAWYKAQEPKPTRDQSDAMMQQIVATCGAYSMAVSAPAQASANVRVQQVEASAPRVAGGGVGMMSSPHTAGGIPEVSRSRQARAAGRWESYYACRTQSFQAWGATLGHAADSNEVGVARAQIDSTCRERFNLPAGPAAILVD